MEFNLSKLFNERVYKARLNGDDYTKLEFAQAIWGKDKLPETLICNVNNLLGGRTKTLKLEWIPIICKELKCTPEELFK